MLLQKYLKESHLSENYGTYLVASTRSMLLQGEPSVSKLWNLLGRLYEIHVAQSFGHLVFPAFLGTAGLHNKTIQSPYF
jgi:hypothetical protein